MEVVTQQVEAVVVEEAHMLRQQTKLVSPEPILIRSAPGVWLVKMAVILGLEVQLAQHHLSARAEVLVPPLQMLDLMGELFRWARVSLGVQVAMVVLGVMTVEEEVEVLEALAGLVLVVM